MRKESPLKKVRREGRLHILLRPSAIPCPLVNEQKAKRNGWGPRVRSAAADGRLAVPHASLKARLLVRRFEARATGGGSPWKH